MATELQKNLAIEIVKNAKRKKPLNKKELLVSAGYDLTTAEATPSRTLEQIGVKESLEELGFDAESAKKVVKRILQAGKEENRLKAADMIFKVTDTYAAEKHLNLNIEGAVSLEVKELTEKLNGIYRGSSIGSDGGTTSPLGTEAQD